jgi:hypothetical protein
MIALAIIALFGPVAYAVAKLRLQQSDGDRPRLAMKELPPE